MMEIMVEIILIVVDTKRRKAYGLRLKAKYKEKLGVKSNKIYA